MDGFLLVDKPIGPSSFAVVKRARNALSCDKVGHCGTLDPLASGLLVVAFGAATRLLPFLPQEPKRYRFRMKFGIETDTLDSEGVVTRQNGIVPGKDALIAALQKFVGGQMQTPPKFSAVKIDGKRAYRRARDKEEFEIGEKAITVFSLELLTYDIVSAEAECEVACSHGTYVRSLVRDIAASLDTVAYATAIRRIAIGLFNVETAVAYDKLDGQSAAFVVPVRNALTNMPSITIDNDQCAMVSHGMKLKLAGLTAETAIAYAENGNVAAVLIRKEAGIYHPDKVFI